MTFQARLDCSSNTITKMDHVFAILSNKGSKSGLKSRILFLLSNCGYVSSHINASLWTLWQIHMLCVLYLSLLTDLKTSNVEDKSEETNYDTWVILCLIILFLSLPLPMFSFPICYMFLLWPISEVYTWMYIYVRILWNILIWINLNSNFSYLCLKRVQKINVSYSIIIFMMSFGQHNVSYLESHFEILSNLIFINYIMFTAKYEFLSLCDQHQIFLWYRSSWQKGTVQDHIDFVKRGLGAHKTQVYTSSTYT